MSTRRFSASFVCPLCEQPLPSANLQLDSGTYFLCSRCDLVSQDPQQRLDRQAEHAYYLTHENDVHDARYRKFLSQLAEPMMERLEQGARGLDFGSGPGPALAAMFTEKGFPTDIYDPRFAPDKSPLDTEYDFVSCTEVIEHMHRPLREFVLLDQLLKPGGLLGVMTELRPSLEAFSSWYYHRDPTHVCFYSAATMEWIAARFQWRLTLIGTRVILWRKPAR